MFIFQDELGWPSYESISPCDSLRGNYTYSGSSISVGGCLLAVSLSALLLAAFGNSSLPVFSYAGEIENIRAY